MESHSGVDGNLASHKSTAICWRYQKAKGITKKRAAPLWVLPFFLLVNFPSIFPIASTSNLQSIVASKKEVFKKIIIFVIHISIVSHIKKFVWLKQSVCDFRILVVSYEIKHFCSCHIYLHLAAPVKRCCPFYFSISSNTICFGRTPLQT